MTCFFLPFFFIFPVSVGCTKFTYMLLILGIVIQVLTRDQQIESMGAVARRLEEKERLLQATLSAVEKELLLRQQAMEMHKRKAIESAQSAADLKLHLGM